MKKLFTLFALLICACGISQAAVTSDFEPVSVSPTPQETTDEASLETLSSILLTFSEPAYITPSDPEYDAWVVAFSHASTRPTQVCTATMSKVDGDDNSILITLDSVISEYGTYSVYIYEGAIGDSTANATSFASGSVIDGTRYYYNVGSVDLGTVTIDPADGSTVDTLQTFVITYEESTNVEFSFDPVPVLYDADGNTVYEWSCTDDDASIDNGEESAVITLTLPDSYIVTEGGTYTLSLPKQTFAVNMSGSMFSSTFAFSDEMTFTYTVTEKETAENENESGISNIAVSANGSYDVYSLTGVKMMTTTDSSAISSLPKGVYIVNGKTVEVK